MKKNIGWVLALVTSFTLSACSHSKKSVDPNAADAVPVADAGTDAVPVGELETPKTDATAQAQPAAVDPNQAPQLAIDAPPAQQPDATAMAEAQPQPVQMSGNFENYRFQSGDTLMKIAFEVYGDLYQWRKIYDQNRDVIRNPNAVPVGTVLKVEKPASPVTIERNGDQYLIKPGDTLGTISDDVYGTKTKWKKLWENNRQMIRDPNRIFAGFYLYYSMTPEEKQQAEQLKQNRPVANPLASAPAMDTGRMPASVAPGTQGVIQPMDPNAPSVAAGQ